MLKKSSGEANPLVNVEFSSIVEHKTDILHVPK